MRHCQALQMSYGPGLGIVCKHCVSGLKIPMSRCLKCLEPGYQQEVSMAMLAALLKKTKEMERRKTPTKTTKEIVAVVTGDSVHSWTGATAAALCAEQPGTAGCVSTCHHR